MQAKHEGTPSRSWSLPVSIHEIPDTGRRFELEADETVRAALAEALDLRALPRVAATFEVTRRGADRLRVVGRVGATVGQTCVVTLEPIESEIEEAVDIEFVRAAATDIGETQDKARRVEVMVEDTPELLPGDTVDLGALATEFLSLGIDPYPRKEGAVFQTPLAEDAADHPFAALARLRRGGQGGNAG
jgi:uncharacterized metal-binding protein YceD (DUF177 family)